jgi:glutamate-ammonia-ligase adenylyltransferase
MCKTRVEAGVPRRLDDSPPGVEADMHVDQLRHSLDSAEQAKSLLNTWTLRDFERGWQNLTHLAEALPIDTLRELCQPLSRLLPRCPDPDGALNNLERFLANPAGAKLLPQLVEGRARTLEIMLQLFSTSQYFSDLLSANPDYLDMLRVPLRRSPSARELQEQLQAEVNAAYEDSNVLLAFRRFRQKQTLRIGTNDIIRERPLEEITRDISRVADVALEVALATALKNLGRRFGEPFTEEGEPARCAVFAFGKHGGEELNYSSDIDLMFVYDEEGSTRGKRVANTDNAEFFGRVVSEVVRLLSANTDRGQAYRIDLRLRPEGQRGPLARSLNSTLAYYDTLGRTWERQALIKLRCVAGDAKLGEEFLRAIEPFVYRKYLSFSEINGIKALKRRIEHRTTQSGENYTEVKTGHGGIRDIEFAIQFLQLLNAGDLPEVRQRNTLLAMQALERVGCITAQEFHFLDDAYRFLRKVEHRLQLLFDMQTHRLPDGHEELHKLARRMGYVRRSDERTAESRGTTIEETAPPGTGADSDSQFRSAILDPQFPAASRPIPSDPLEAFLTDYREKTDLNRKILDHLLHQTFEGEDGRAEPESDLLLDPHPEPETIKAVLGRYPFRDVTGAYQNLTQLARETVPFLPSRRCRHFLASIAPSLLRALSLAPDPDMALVNLEKVTASLGAKCVLWELFSFNPPSLKLYVDLCAWSQYLSELLINNPGMIDELLDSLVLNQPRTGAELREELTELCRGAADLDPILHSFQDTEILRIGVRDILGKNTIRQTTAALSDLAETILVQIAQTQEPVIRKRFGEAYLSEGPRAGQPSRHAILALGKLGGRELSYHSDLDLILIYEGDGRTGAPVGASRFDKFPDTDNFHYFTELAQRIIKATSLLGPMGRLYQVDMRLRPTGKSGSLVIPLSEFRRYYDGGGAQLWERQSLTRARVVHGDPEFGAEVMATVIQGAFEFPWKPEYVDEIATMRERLEGSRKSRDLKRGFGGLVDVEFLVQLLQMKYARTLPALRTPNTWETIEAAGAAGLMTPEQQETLKAGYDFLRVVQGSLRIVQNRSLDEVPENREELEKLALRLDYGPGPDGGPGDRFLAQLERHTKGIRELFLTMLERERAK